MFFLIGIFRHIIAETLIITYKNPDIINILRCELMQIRVKPTKMNENKSNFVLVLKFCYCLRLEHNSNSEVLMTLITQPIIPERSGFRIFISERILIEL